MAHDTATATAAPSTEPHTPATPPEAGHVPDTGLPLPTSVDPVAAGELFKGLYSADDVKVKTKGGKQALELSQDRTRELVDDQGTMADRKVGHTRKVGVHHSDKGPGVSVGASRKKNGVTHGGSLSLDAGGPVASYERTRDLGNGRSRSFSGSVNAKTGELNAGYKFARNKTDSLSVGAGLDLGEHGLDGANAKIGGTKGDSSASLGGGFKRTMGKPTRTADGRWSVTYNLTGNASVGGGHVAEAGVEGELSRGGTRVFATKEQAEAFSKRKGAAISDDPMDLGIGEQITRSRAGKLKVGAESSTPVTVGGSIGAGKMTGETITRVDASHIEVALSSGRSGSVAPRAGAGPVSVSAGGELTESRERRYRFDVSTAEGREAFASYQKTGVAPPALEVGFSREDGTGRTLGANVLGAGVSTGRKTSTRVDLDEHHRINVTHSGTRTKGASLPFLGEHSASATLRSSQDGGTDLIAGVTSSDGLGSMEELAEATGTRAERRADARSSGSWSVESHLDDEQLKEFARRVVTGGKVVLAPLGKLDGDGADLQAAIKRSKNIHQLREAMAEFVASAGGKGAAWMRQIAGVTDYDVKLDNDENFTGAAGREAMEARIAAHAESPDRGAIAADLAELEKRRAAIGDRSRYTDLPPDVRKHEVERIGVWIAHLRHLARK